MAEESIEDDLEKDADGLPGGEVEEEPKSSHRRLIIILLAGVLVFGGLGGGLMYFAENPESLSVVGLNVSDGDISLAEKSAPVEESFYFETGEIIADLRVPRGKRGFIRVRMILATGSEEETKWIRDIMPKIIDAAQVYLRQKSPGELLGTAGSEMARKDLLKAFKAVARPTNIKDLLFRQFVVQGPTG